MTLEEKVNVTRGHTGQCVGNSGAVPRLGVPQLCLADAPAGIRGQEFVSAFPAGLHAAATFDKDLMHAYGLALGREYYGKGINVALGPVCGPLGRVARGGRNWEGASADPYLAGIQVGEMTAGIQEAGVIAVPKHFLLNEQEWRRIPTEGLGESMSSNVDDRSLHELYSFPFMNALKAGAGSVMCSYQRANNSYGCQNSKLLNGILKSELGFEGFIVSDWEAQHAGVASANAGLDLVMPDGGFWGKNLSTSVTNGSVPAERVDDMVTRILASWYYLGQDEGFPEPGVYPSTTRHEIIDVQADHGNLIREIGAAGTVLVKNTNNALPLKDPRFLAIYGYDATVDAVPWDNPSRFGGGYEVNFNWTTINGTLIMGGGSGTPAPPYLISPFHALSNRIVEAKGTIRWDFWSEDPPTTYINADAAIVFINAYASESFDRWSLKDEFSDNLVSNIASKYNNTIVVYHSAGTVNVDAWIENPNITAVLLAGAPGQESGNSLVDVLYGDVNPSGKLPYTVAKNEGDFGHMLNSSLGGGVDVPYPQDNFTEGLYIDYRYFDQQNITPRYEFGFGLSYTTFSFSDISTEIDNGLAEFPDPATPVVQGGHPELWDVVAYAEATVTNTGEVAGAEVAQLYLGIPTPEGSQTTPARQLRGFEKVYLEPGESRKVTFDLTRRDLSIWDVVAQQWRLQTGEFTFEVGSSSRDLALRECITR